MVEKKKQPKKISMGSTKQEMLDAYNALIKQLQEKGETELKPEDKIEEKKNKEVVEVAVSLSLEGIIKGISNLKMETGKLLTQISDGMEEEFTKFKKLQQAIEIKEKELKEVYEIEKSAATLTALIEVQNQKHHEFETEMTAQKEELNQEIQTIRAQWEKEKTDHVAAIKERDAMELKKQERDKEEYAYTFNREQELAKDKLEDEKTRIEKEIYLKKDQMEKEMAERENAIVEKEDELNELRKRVISFPKEMETAVNKAIKETTDRILLEAENKEELIKREFNGERNVLTTRIESLEKTVKEQSDQIAKLSQQLEKAYQKVQDIAVKAVEGSSNLKSLTSLQQLMTEQTRKQSL